LSFATIVTLNGVPAVGVVVAGVTWKAWVTTEVVLTAVVVMLAALVQLTARVATLVKFVPMTLKTLN
jgi:hypothetical protein